MTHKVPHGSFFAFLPWLAFWSQGGSALPDYAHLRVGLAAETSNCKNLDHVFKTTLVRTNESRAKGLGGRSTPLAHDEAMLFIFDQAQPVNFWMKDTLIPLEIAYFDTKGRLAQVLEMPVEPDPTNPVKHYLSLGSVIAALEIAPGTLKHVRTRSSILCVETAPTPAR